MENDSKLEAEVLRLALRAADIERKIDAIADVVGRIYEKTIQPEPEPAPVVDDGPVFVGG